MVPELIFDVFISISDLKVSSLGFLKRQLPVFISLAVLRDHMKFATPQIYAINCSKVGSQKFCSRRN